MARSLGYRKGAELCPPARRHGVAVDKEEQGDPGPGEDGGLSSLVWSHRAPEHEFSGASEKACWLQALALLPSLPWGLVASGSRRTARGLSLTRSHCRRGGESSPLTELSGTHFP